MAIGRLTIFAALAAGFVLTAVLYPHATFSTVAGALVVFSTSSTLVFFAFVALSAVLGFDSSPRRTVEQAQPTRYRDLGDQFTA